MIQTLPALPEGYKSTLPRPVRSLIPELRAGRWVYLYSYNYGLGWCHNWIRFVGGSSPQWQTWAGGRARCFRRITKYLDFYKYYTGEASVPPQPAEIQRMLMLYKRMPTRPECVVLTPTPTLDAEVPIHPVFGAYRSSLP